ncbi:lipopolysaccharide biosynthesis protein [Marinilactibacillus sp. Marseille-P9653]|uniref:lipopolysaccharide biosynthesis protein n=1 Tax=Marinilactibacillus sp. Marseille-P9653 TaxID=2866583 RepID=UPI001CE4604E|nr:polysaccharide biosynthesis C-terminal domain-containing protein [Marinilactibacillus sp. Marseille-P9653]
MYKKLVSNSLVFAIGNLGSKLITFLLVPLYTYYLTTSEYGTVDLIIVTASLLMPIVTASVFEAILRFILDKDQDKKNILSNSVVICMGGIFLLILMFPVLNYFQVFGKNLVYLYLILIVQIFEVIFSQYARATNRIRIFALNGILLALANGTLNILLLIYLNLGISGYFFSIIIAHILSILFLITTTQALKDIDLKLLNKMTVKELLSFSIPMVPNSIMWWTINASSRYFIVFFIGTGANGLFAISSKIPSLLNIINQIFIQAWQISAIEEYDNNNKTKFHTIVFSYLSSVMFVGSSIIFVTLKFLFSLLFADAYYDAWRAVPFLVLGTVFSTFSGFLGTNYVTSKKTSGVFKTSIYGGVVSIILNIILVPLWGIEGAGMSSLVSFFVMFLIRYFDTKQFVNIQIDWKKFITNITIITIQIVVLMLPIENSFEILVQIVLFLIILISNKNLLTPFKMLIKSRKF